MTQETLIALLFRAEIKSQSHRVTLVIIYIYIYMHIPLCSIIKMYSM